MGVYFTKDGRKYRVKLPDPDALMQLMKTSYDIEFCSEIDGKRFCVPINRVEAARLLIGKPVKKECEDTKCTIFLQGNRLMAKKRII